MGAAPSASLWLCAPRGADFLHLLYFLYISSILRPRPLCGCGPLVWLILLILLVFRWSWVAGGGCALVVGPLVGLILLILLVFRWF